MLYGFILTVIVLAPVLPVTKHEEIHVLIKGWQACERQASKGKLVKIDRVSNKFSADLIHSSGKINYIR